MLGFNLQCTRRSAVVFETQIIDGSECLMLFNGLFYEKIDVDFLEKLIKLSKNSIKKAGHINLIVENSNKEIFDSFHEPYQEKSVKKVKSGFVYIFKCNHTGLYKIGCTTRSVEKRLKEILTYNPTVEFHFSFKVKDIEFEKEIHKVFSEFRVNGEWFNFSSDHIIDIERRINLLNLKS